MWMLSGERKVALWHAGLSAVGVVNLGLWAASRGQAHDSYGAAQWALAGAFTAVCAFRSFLPRVDLERFVLVDHPLSSVFVGRSPATAAELCFAVQVALALRLVADSAGLPWIGAYALFVVPLLAAAQLFCWYSVATLDHGGHAVEESLWALAHAGSGLCMALAYPRAPAELRPYCLAGALLAAVFVAFMATVDVPMYLRRWRAGRAQGAAYLPLSAGLRDAWTRRIPTRRWEHWREEVAWLSLYFSCAVWISLLMGRLPR